MPAELTREQGKRLLKLARESIMTYFRNKKPDLSGYEEFSRKQGVFVTITEKSILKGCIGFPEPVKALNKAVVEAAREAAFNDPRFHPIQEDELRDIDIEISVLTEPEEIVVMAPEGYPDNITIGEDGLIVRSAFGSGLLLPQVFVDHGCDAETALDWTCEKAGLPSNEWRKGHVKVYKFQAQIFSEAK